MKQVVGEFILKVPYTLLRKVLYLYVGAVIFWNSASFLSLVLWIIILITLLVIGYQSNTRITNMMHEHSKNGKGYVERMRAPFTYWGPRLFIVLTASILAGYFLNGQFGLNGVQIFFLAVGYVVFYRDTGLFGAFVAYIVTDRGIGIHYIPGHTNYQTFINFTEIKSIVVVQAESIPSPSWSYLTSYKSNTGLLLNPINSEGFSEQDIYFFIAPKDIRAFLSHLPQSVKIIEQ